MTKPHKHAELIKAWADGVEIQVLMESGKWEDMAHPKWYDVLTYRIKPQPKLYQQRVEIPTSLTVEEAISREYVWTPYFSNSCDQVAKWSWLDNRRHYAKLGLAYATKGEAQARYDAMLATEEVC